MSSKFVVFKPGIKVESGDGYVIRYSGMGEEVCDGAEFDYTIIGSSNYIDWKVEALVLRLHPNTPIYCIDNCTEFKTLGEYLKSLGYEIEFKEGIPEYKMVD